MSYKVALTDLSRGDGPSLTRQIAGVFSHAIRTGELGPGDRLPPTREVAEVAGVNHLTAVRAYRRLRDEGLVVAHVGRGTFVRRATPVTDDGGRAAVLPPDDRTDQARALAEMFEHVGASGIVPMSAGYPPSESLPVEAIADALAAGVAEHGAAAVQYDRVEGTSALREAVAARMSEELPVSPDEVLVTNGAWQALAISSRGLVRPGDAIAVEAPTYLGILDAVRSAGARPVSVPVDEEGLDVGELERALAAHEIRAVFCQSRIHNPTGSDISEDRVERLARLARRHGFLIVDDQVWADLRFDGAPGPALRGLAPAHTVTIGSVSKTLGGGLRVGWLHAPGPVLDRLAEEKRRADLHSPVPTQLAVARMMSSGSFGEHLVRSAAIHRERRDAALEAASRHLRDLATWEAPRGGGQLWLTLLRDLDDRDLHDEAVRQGVSVLPGGAMFSERPARTHVRLSFGYVGADEIDEGLERLARAIRALGTRQRRSGALPV